MLWLNWLLFFLLIAGHTEVQVTLVNRIHSRKIHGGALRSLRHLHDVLMVLFPGLLVWFVGINGPRLLSGGSWRNVAWGWWVCFAICLLGFVGLVISCVRWRMRQSPRELVRHPSRTIDFAKRLGRRPIGVGPFRYLAKLPGNEIFRVEFADVHLHLPSLPPAWDGLTILHLTDWHLIGTIDRTFFEAVVAEAERCPPDLICFTGDLLDDLNYLDWLPSTLGRLKAPLGKFFILGNHDWLLDPPSIRQAMEDLGWRDLASRTVTIDHLGRPLTLGGTERPWMGEHPDFSTAPAAAFRVLLSHTPDNFRWAQQQQVRLMLSGHNHGGQVVLPVVGPVYSPSTFGVRYSAGAWYENQTLLYVSRGLSAKHPLRWNCPPEVTTLTLHCAPVDQIADHAAVNSLVRVD